MTVDKYMAEFYAKDHDEYLVNNAVLQCSMATTDFKSLRGKVYNVPSPNTTTFLNVTEYNVFNAVLQAWWNYYAGGIWADR